MTNRVSAPGRQPSHKTFLCRLLLRALRTARLGGMQPAIWVFTNRRPRDALAPVGKVRAAFSVEQPRHCRCEKMAGVVSHGGEMVRCEPSRLETDRFRIW